jgi:putative selenium metabolism hydrolase
MISIQDRIIQLNQEIMPELISFAQKIIRVPSLTGEENEVSEIILQEMNRLGYDEAFRDDWGNIIGLVHGSGKGPTIMYNGHMDHVDIGSLSEWQGYAPYGGEIDRNEILTELGDKLESTTVIHGRAAADTKCGIACQVYSGAILARLKKEGYTFAGTYMVSAVVMEEPAEQIGMIGLVEDTMKKHGIPLHGVVSCEATGLKLYLGHRGRVELNVEVLGVTSHGSAPWLGVNAVVKATTLIQAVEAWYSTHTQADPFLGQSSIALTVISCKPGAMCIVPDSCSITYDRRLTPAETPEQAVAELQAIIDRLSKADPDFRASVRIAAVPRTTYTGKTVTLPNIKEGWRIDKAHPFVEAAANGLRSIGEPVSYGYWDFGTDLAMICGRHFIPAVGYSPMQEYYCHRPVDKCRIDFMQRATRGNIAIFQAMAALPEEAFTLK